MNVEAIVQRNADSARLLEAGLRNHDPETVEVARTRISRDYGEEVANKFVLQTITQMMENEGWSFFDQDGNPSPLL